jgi:CRP-like cAMP-binding protein
MANRILSGLSPADLGLLEPHLEPVDLPIHRPLEGRNRRIDHVYFIEAGFASVVANGSGKPSIEVGIIGREGMTGLAVVVGYQRASHDTYVQAAGTGQRIRADKLREADERSNTLHWAMLRYAHAYLLQTTATALANERSKIEERLARWLLMANDRIDGDQLPLTHEFLSLMLGVLRSGGHDCSPGIGAKGPHFQASGKHPYPRSQRIGGAVEWHLYEAGLSTKAMTLTLSASTARVNPCGASRSDNAEAPECQVFRWLHRHELYI